LLEFGPRLKINLGDVSDGVSDSRIQFSVRGVFDVNDHLSYHGISFEPQWVKEIVVAGDWETTTSLGMVFGNQQLVDTFYRVTPAEATSARPAYNAQSGLISKRASFFASRMIAHDVRFFGYLRFDSVEGAANHCSPLVQRDNGWTAAIGLVWTLKHSERVAND
jgi:outer membrane scaffolding protein for murein synthesis (MipA/OmpV family)